MTDMKITSDGIARWVSFDPQPLDLAAIKARCTPQFLTQALGRLGELEIVSACVNTSGQYAAAGPSIPFPIQVPDRVVVSDLPPFCDVVVNVRGPGGHVATITIWVPLNWNGRFLGTLGGGNRTDSIFGMPETMRTLCIPTALRNGFATAKTDGANKSNRYVADWALNPKTGAVDWDLTENWIHRSTHEMTVIGKAVTEAIHARAPQYAYVAGCSGGGRQALIEAQRYPGDYDGVWSSDPAINWTRFIAAELWPALVMKEIAVLPPAKLEAFRAAAIEACDGIDGLRDGIIGAFDPCDFDARRIIGQTTKAGDITERDAQAMNMIWQGPRTRDGRFLWHGLGVGNESWGANWFRGGVCMVAEVDGELQPAPFDMIIGYIRGWLAKDPHWDWKTLTFDGYERLFERSVQEMACAASDDSDLAGLRAAGGKLMITHGSCDPLIPYRGTVDYYRRVVEMIGSEEATRSFARLFISEGDGHGACRDPGPGVTLADGMAALMRWVELGEAPDAITGRALDLMTGKVSATRPVYAYPHVPQYRGEGNSDDAANFRPVHFSERAELSPAVSPTKTSPMCRSQAKQVVK